MIFLVIRDVICQWFWLMTSLLLKIIGNLTRDQKALFTVTHALFFMSFSQEVFPNECKDTWITHV